MRVPPLLFRCTLPRSETGWLGQLFGVLWGLFPYQRALPLRNQDCGAVLLSALSVYLNESSFYASKSVEQGGHFIHFHFCLSNGGPPHSALADLLICLAVKLFFFVYIQNIHLLKSHNHWDFHKIKFWFFILFMVIIFSVIVIALCRVVFIVSSGVRLSHTGFIHTRGSQETLYAWNLALLLLCNIISLIPASLFTVHSLQPYQSCIKFLLMQTEHFPLLFALKAFNWQNISKMQCICHCSWLTAIVHQKCVYIFCIFFDQF